MSRVPRTGDWKPNVGLWVARIRRLESLRCLGFVIQFRNSGFIQLIEEAAAGTVILRVPEIAVADIFYTLTAPMMKIPRANAARQLAALLQQPGIEVENRSRVLDTLGLCETKNIDDGDADLIVLAKSTVQPLPILSYDQDFAKVSEITAFSPVDWLQKGRKLLE